MKNSASFQEQQKDIYEKYNKKWEESKKNSKEEITGEQQPLSANQQGEEENLEKLSSEIKNSMQEIYLAIDTFATDFYNKHTSSDYLDSLRKFKEDINKLSKYIAKYQSLKITKIDFFDEVIDHLTICVTVLDEVCNNYINDPQENWSNHLPPLVYNIWLAKEIMLTSKSRKITTNNQIIPEVAKLTVWQTVTFFSLSQKKNEIEAKAFLKKLACVSKSHYDISKKETLNLFMLGYYDPNKFDAELIELLVDKKINLSLVEYILSHKNATPDLYVIINEKEQILGHKRKIDTTKKFELEVSHSCIHLISFLLKKGKNKAVILLLSKGADIHTVNVKQYSYETSFWSVLEDLFLSKSPQIINWLIKKLPKILGKPLYGELLLEYKMSKETSSMILHYLDKLKIKFDFTQLDLKEFIINGQPEVVDKILAATRNLEVVIDQLIEYGQMRLTPLGLTLSTNNSEEMLKVLLNYGASSLADNFLIDQKRESNWVLAFENHNFIALKLMLLSQKFSKLKEDRQKSILNDLFEKTLAINNSEFAEQENAIYNFLDVMLAKLNFKRQDLLQRTISEKLNILWLFYLHEKNSLLDEIFDNGKNIFHIAFSSWLNLKYKLNWFFLLIALLKRTDLLKEGEERLFDKTCQVLLKSAEYPKIITALQQPNSLQQLPLHLACKCMAQGWETAVLLIINFFTALKPVDLKNMLICQDISGKTPAHYLLDAAEYSELLVSRVFNKIKNTLYGWIKETMNIQDKEGYTPVHYCIVKLPEHFVPPLSELQGFNFDLTTKRNETLLHLAVKNKKAKITKELLENKQINPETKDVDGKTAEDYACNSPYVKEQFENMRTMSKQSIRM